MSLWGITRLDSGKYEVQAGWGIYLVPTLGDAIRLKIESWF